MWMGLYQWLVKVSWLGKLVSVFWWVELYFFSLECNEVSSNVLCCWRICMVCLVLELVGPWMVLGFSVGMEAFDELLLINGPWSHEFSDVLRMWS